MSTTTDKLTEIVRKAIIAADMDRVADAIDEVTDERVSVWAISAMSSETEPGVIRGTFEGEILSRKGKDNPLYLEFKVSVALQGEVEDRADRGAH